MHYPPRSAFATKLSLLGLRLGLSRGRTGLGVRLDRLRLQQLAQSLSLQHAVAALAGAALLLQT